MVDIATRLSDALLMSHLRSASYSHSHSVRPLQMKMRSAAEDQHLETLVEQELPKENLGRRQVSGVEWTFGPASLLILAIEQTACRL
jgi:hypothetical protein